MKLAAELSLPLGRLHELSWRDHRTKQQLVRLEGTRRKDERVTKKIPEPTNTEMRNSVGFTGSSLDTLTSVTT